MKSEIAAFASSPDWSIMSIHAVYVSVMHQLQLWKQNASENLPEHLGLIVFVHKALRWFQEVECRGNILSTELRELVKYKGKLLNLH